ncbi:MAG: ABC transporter substrate-binding protein, partial [Planctomycetota bacterium]
LYPKERVIRDLYFGLAVPHDGPVHAWESHYVKDLERFPYDPGKAAAMLDAAGWKLNERGVREKVVDGERKELVIRGLWPTQNPISGDTIQLFKKSAQQAGVVVESVQREWSVMLKNLEDRDFDLCVLGWANVWDGNPIQIWHSKSGRLAKGSNHISYSNPEVDAIIDGLETEFDPAKRKELWGRFQRTTVADQPYCFNSIRTRPWVVNNRLANHFFCKIRPQEWFLPWYVK